MAGADTSADTSAVPSAIAGKSAARTDTTEARTCVRTRRGYHPAYDPCRKLRLIARCVSLGKGWSSLAHDELHDAHFLAVAGPEEGPGMNRFSRPLVALVAGGALSALSICSGGVAYAQQIPASNGGG